MSMKAQAKKRLFELAGENLSTYYAGISNTVITFESGWCKYTDPDTDEVIKFLTKQGYIVYAVVDNMYLFVSPYTSHWKDELIRIDDHNYRAQVAYMKNSIVHFKEVNIYSHILIAVTDLPLKPSVNIKGAHSVYDIKSTCLELDKECVLPENMDENTILYTDYENIDDAINVNSFYRFTGEDFVKL